VTHSSNLPEVIRWVYSQNLDRDLPVSISTLPNVRKPTTVQRVSSLVIVRLNYERSWKQGLVVTDPVRSAYTTLADFWHETIQHLTNRTEKGEWESSHLSF